VRIKFIFERNTACPSGFSRGRNTHSFKIGLFRSIEETCIYRNKTIYVAI
jgi:hypothetical protein